MNQIEIICQSVLRGDSAASILPEVADSKSCLHRQDTGKDHPRTCRHNGLSGGLPETYLVYIGRGMCLQTPLFPLPELMFVSDVSCIAWRWKRFSDFGSTSPSRSQKLKPTKEIQKVVFLACSALSSSRQKLDTSDKPPYFKMG
ncbi:hypothetical protein J6590_011702 [Homalodisca vitripennis]|nr:hypothetical protein J6590_011702 [Homalodisca vitripennis]